MPEITLLGTGGMLPLKNRYLTSLYAEQNGKALLIDCGEGTQVAMAQHGLKLSRIQAIFLTHPHADHTAGLPGLLLTIGNTGRSQPLPVYCGESCTEMVRHLLYVTCGLPYEVEIHPLPENRSSAIALGCVDPLLTVETLPLRHRVPCLGYRLTFAKKAVFQPEQARALEIPLPFWKPLHSGETVTLPDGRKILPMQVTGEPRPPVRITYTTDTLPIPEIAGFAAGSDLFICEGMWGDPEKKQSMDQKRHMLMQDACRLAKEAAVQRLWLTHYSPAETEPEQYAALLQAIFPETVTARDGEHICLK